MPNRPKAAILIVNGFSRKDDQAEANEAEAVQFPWIDVCLRQIARHTEKTPHRIFVWDNAWLPSHDAIYEAYPNVVVKRAKQRGKSISHGLALNKLTSRLNDTFEYVVTLDNDAFPVRGGWLTNLIDRLEGGAKLAGVWRDEMAPEREPFVHPSCLAFRKADFESLEVGFRFRKGEQPGKGQDVGERLTREVLRRGGELSRLWRSNRRNVHFLMGGLYGDLIFHQGAGSRRPKFWTSPGTQREEEIREALRNAAFTDVDQLIGYLSGDLPDSVGKALGLQALPGSQGAPEYSRPGLMQRLRQR